MQGRILFSQITKIAPAVGDAISIEEALESESPIKNLAGFVAFKNFLERMLDNLTKEDVRQQSDIAEELEKFVHGKGEVIKKALLRERKAEVDYHEQGLDAFIYLI